MLDIILVLVGYVVGSISCAILVCRAIGAPDPRSTGSRNPGATNVLRVAGKKAAAATLVGDSLKGLLPLLAGRWLGADHAMLAMIGMAAFLGHLYPIFFGFRGGKGVATLIGVLLGLAWPLGLIFIAIWLLMAKVFRISSLSALIASLMMPPVGYAFALPPSYLVTISIMVVLLLWRHRSNIRNLLNGGESHIGNR
jgi:glycerol-3-phosphate acyltransferase PlsY